MHTDRMRNISLLVLSLLLVAVSIQCSSPAPQVVEKVVTQQVEKVVKETVVVQQEKVVEQTVVVPQEAQPMAPSGNAADIAVEAAKQYAGTTLTISYEAGLQAQDAYAFGPEWTNLTGINVNVVEVPFEELYSNTINDHLAGTSEVDVINVVPAWMGDFVAAGVLAPLDQYVEQYYPQSELDDWHPTYLNNWAKVGDTWYALPDDGDVHILYYRRSIFEDEANQQEFQDEYGYELAPPETWEQFNDICEFLTNKLAPDVYGCAFQRTGGQDYHWFHSAFRALGGKFFDPETMKAQVNNEIGVQTAQLLRESLDYGPPGEAEMDFIGVFSEWMAGHLAMAISWPPPGRWSEGYGSQTEQLAWLPPTEVAGDVGYAIQPGGGELAAGFSLGISADSPNQEAAYLFAQWLTSKDISLQRVMTPFALRDPYRLSHYTSPLYRTQWSYANEYLETLKTAADTGYLDLMFPGSREYENATDQAMTAIYSGADIQQTLDQLASEWDAITERLGVDSQREAYQEWASRSNAY